MSKKQVKVPSGGALQIIVKGPKPTKGKKTKKKAKNVKKKKRVKKKKVKKKEAEKKEAKKEAPCRKLNILSILGQVGESSEHKVFGVHGCTTVHCKLCDRFFQSRKTLGKHVADRHGTTLAEYEKLYSTMPVNASQNTVNLAEFVDALIVKTVTGAWPDWFTMASRIELPDDPTEAGAPVQDALALMQQARLKHLIQFAGISERNLLTLEAASAEDPALTGMLLTNLVYPELERLGKELNERVATRATARRAGVRIEPKFIFLSPRGQEALREASLVIDGDVLDDREARAQLSRGAAQVAGLLTGKLDTSVPPTQVGKQPEAEGG